MIDQMQLQYKVNSFIDLWAVLTRIGDPSQLKHIINVNLLCLTIKTIWDAYVITMKRYQQNNVHEPLFTPWCVLSILDNYWIELTNEIKAHARIVYIIKTRNRFSDQRTPGSPPPLNERTQALMNRPTLRFYFKPYGLTQTQAGAYHEHWTKTDIVTVEQAANGKMRLKPTPPSW